MEQGQQDIVGVMEVVVPVTRRQADVIAAEAKRTGRTVEAIIEEVAAFVASAARLTLTVMDTGSDEVLGKEMAS